MLLQNLLQGINEIEIKGITKDINISSIAYDSRKVTPGSLFICIQGYKADGHDFIDDAAAKGAAAVLINKDADIPEGIVKIKHSNTRKALAQIASNFYNNPSSRLNLIGVTGTKGKTTTTFMIKSILEKHGHKVGLIGTIANYVGNNILPAERTTPEALELQQMFSEMLEQGVDTVVMEVSSHSLDLYRVYANDFDVGVFTNLSRDHLDFHLNFENYFSAKAKLFEMCKHAAVNVDDLYGQRLIDKYDSDFKSFGLENKADIYGHSVNISPRGTTFRVSHQHEDLDVSVAIPGRFSVYNALAAIAACLKFEVSSQDIIKGLEKVKVPGRAETVETNQNFTVMVDYAHSPDSLENILQAVKTFAKGRIVAIFGCGGDRDKTKRPIMGEIAGKIADFTIITSDNPRTEEPEVIIKEIEQGIKTTKGEYIIISDRKSAIEYAIENAFENDIILIAGKGHETYQIFKDKTIHFDDREIASDALKRQMNGSCSALKKD